MRKELVHKPKPDGYAGAAHRLCLCSAHFSGWRATQIRTAVRRFLHLQRGGGGGVDSSDWPDVGILRCQLRCDPDTRQSTSVTMVVAIYSMVNILARLWCTPGLYPRVAEKL